MKVNNSRFENSANGLKEAHRFVVEKQDVKTKFTFNTFGTNKIDAEKYCEYLNRKNNTSDWSVQEI